MDADTSTERTSGGAAAAANGAQAPAAAAIPALVPRSRAATARAAAPTIIGAITAAHEAKVSKLVMDGDTTFAAPKRAIFNERDLKEFQKSQTYRDIAGFIDLLNLAVRNTNISDEYPVTPTVGKLVDVLDTLLVWVNEVPPVKQPMRFGNKAFRTWHAKVAEAADGMLEELLPEAQRAAVAELKAYFLGSFGHPVRIDYGTGHETSFMIFLLCLYRLDAIRTTDLPAAVLRVFAKYLIVCRKLQTTYWLEPAGSKGVWSLDDYQMLVFLLGSSQYHDHKHLKPKCIHDEDVLEHFAKDNMYLQAINFIKSVKHGGGFSNYAPMLHDISRLPTWAKVNSGMVKMYFGEVLDKLPVSQHLLFGTLLPYTWTPSRAPELPQVDPNAATTGAVDSCCMAPWATGGGPAPPPTGVAPWAAARRGDTAGAGRGAGAGAPVTRAWATGAAAASPGAPGTAAGPGPVTRAPWARGPQGEAAVAAGGGVSGSGGGAATTAGAGGGGAAPAAAAPTPSPWAEFDAAVASAPGTPRAET